MTDFYITEPPSDESFDFWMSARQSLEAVKLMYPGWDISETGDLIWRKKGKSLSQELTLTFSDKKRRFKVTLEELCDCD